MRHRQPRASTSAARFSRRSFLKCAGSVGLALPLALTACENGDRSQTTTLKIGYFAEAQDLSGTVIDHIPSTSVMSCIYNSLVGFDYKTGETRPELATEWTQTDELTWVFKLREGVQFHKGYGELTADDIVFNVSHTLESNAPRGIAYGTVQSATAIDKYTVEYHLAQPYTPFLTTVVGKPGGFVFSQKAFSEIGEANFGRNPIGTGPFHLESWEAGKNITLQKHDQYWRTGAPTLASVVWVTSGDSETRQSLLLTRLLDLVDFPNEEGINQFMRHGEYFVDSPVGWNWDCLSFNMSSPPFDNKLVRQAVSYAVDRDRIKRRVYSDKAASDEDPLPAGFSGQPETTRYGNRSDLEMARKLLSEVSLSSDIKARCIVLEWPQLAAEAEEIAAQLGELGMTIEVMPLGAADYWERRRTGQFEMALEENQILGHDPDSALYPYLHSSADRLVGYANEELDRLLGEGRTLPMGELREENYRRILELVLEDAPVVTVRHRNATRIGRKGVQGYVAGPQDGIWDLEQVEIVPYEGRVG